MKQIIIFRIFQIVENINKFVTLIKIKIFNKNQFYIKSINLKPLKKLNLNKYTNNEQRTNIGYRKDLQRQVKNFRLHKFSSSIIILKLKQIRNQVTYFL